MFDEPTMGPPQDPIANEPPYWFEEALKNAPKSHYLQVMDCNIHYLRWGPEVSDLNGILFIHGASAHAHWWDFVAPFFCHNRPVAALDLSGMGDSDWRDRYGSAVHVAEIDAVLHDAKLGEKPIIVGHSFGGFMTMCYGHTHGAEISGAVIVDSPLRPENRPTGEKSRHFDPPSVLQTECSRIRKRWYFVFGLSLRKFATTNILWSILLVILLRNATVGTPGNSILLLGSRDYMTSHWRIICEN